MSEIEARLARRLAIAFWKGERAERIEVALFDAAPKLRPPQAGFQWEQADPLTTFDLKRFNAVRGYQAQQGREISRCLKELRQLRKDALAECTGEPENVQENEPGSPPAPANDDAPTRPAARSSRPTRSRRETNPSPSPLMPSGRSTACRCSTCGGTRVGIRWLRRGPGRAVARRQPWVRSGWPGEGRRPPARSLARLQQQPAPPRAVEQQREGDRRPPPARPASTATAWPNSAQSKRCSTSTARMPSNTGADGSS